MCAVPEQERGHAIVPIAGRPVGEAVDFRARRELRVRRLHAGECQRSEVEAVARRRDARRSEVLHLQRDVGHVELRRQPMLARTVHGEQAQPQVGVEAIEFRLPARRTRLRRGRDRRARAWWQRSFRWRRGKTRGRDWGRRRGQCRYPGRWHGGNSRLRDGHPAPHGRDRRGEDHRVQFRHAHHPVTRA